MLFEDQPSLSLVAIGSWSRVWEEKIEMWTANGRQQHMKIDDSISHWPLALVHTKKVTLITNFRN
jgi:hypothetical protein